ncbi:MAG TPA: GMC family oxidoreductase [Puia sp.]|jgi:choline dehydrogenase-like flavoprotein|nr:GMC family oxidoreductase [Puia sp.]
MHTDARDLPNNTLIQGDICIIGTGPAGLSIAMEWDHTPHKVILLEGGGFQYDDQMQDLYAGPATGQRYYPLRSTRLHYFGGTSNHWAGFCSTFEPLDFEKRDWVPHSGWPMKKSDLDPFYAKAQQVLDLGPYEYDVAYWQRKDPALHSLLPDNPAVWNKVWQFSPPTRFAKKYGDPIKKSKNIHLYTYAHVTEISANDPVRSIDKLTVRNFAGKTHTVKARYYILACNTVQNARLLLAACPQTPKGLGNDHDLVGRFFMEHLEVQAAWLHLPAPSKLKLYTFSGIGSTPMRCELSITPELQAKYRMLNGTCSFMPWELSKDMTPAIKMWSSEDPRKNEDSMRSMWSSHESSTATNKEGFKVYELKTRIEQAPNPDSRITLASGRDGLGMPRAQLNWVLTPFEKYSIRTFYELVGQQVGQAAVGRIRLMDWLQDPNDHSWPDTTGGGWHHMGTTRMSDDPQTGVVDANCKLHGVSNLYIAGASCFVTAAAPNPTLTITALSLRLSAHLKKVISR